MHESNDSSLRTLIFNKSIMNKKHRLRESVDSFRFNQKRSSHNSIHEETNSLDRFHPAANIPKLYDGKFT